MNARPFRPLLIGLLAHLALPIAAQAEEGFPSVYAQMNAAIGKLENFSATVAENSNTPNGKLKKVTKIDYAGPGRFRIDTRWQKSVSGIERQTITSNGETVLVVRFYREGRTVCYRYDLKKMRGGRRPHMTVPKKMFPLKTKGHDLARFKLKNVANKDGAQVAHYVCKRDLKGKKKDPNSTGKIEIWVNMGDMLPRKVVTYRRSETMPTTAKEYSNIIRNRDFSSEAFSCDVPEGAKCIDATLDGCGSARHRH